MIPSPSRELSKYIWMFSGKLPFETDDDFMRRVERGEPPSLPLDFMLRVKGGSVPPCL